MKKHFYLLIAIFCIVGCSSSQSLGPEKNDLVQEGLTGDVKSVKSELFNLIQENDTFKIGDKVNGQSLDRNSLIKFNKKGNIMSSKEFLSNEEISLERIYKYDNNNRLIHRKEVDYYGKDSFIDYFFSYNSVDSITQVIISNQQFERIHHIERDDKNRVIKTTVVQNDSIIAIYTRSYDGSNNIIEEKEYRKENVPVKFTTRTFDKRNLKQVEQITEYSQWETLSYKIEYSYDPDLNLVEEKEYQNDSVSMKIINSYFRNGSLRETTTIPMSGLYAVTVTRKFNEYGDLVEHLREPNDKRNSDSWVYKYKYDLNGNWIEKIIYVDKKPLNLVKRSIEYYK